MADSDQVQISKYDRMRGSLKDIALFSKPSTVQVVQQITGKAETFVVTSARYDEGGGYYVFIEAIDENNQVTRLCLPPKVANAINSQREGLAKRKRKIASKAAMAKRMADGYVPTFAKKHKKQ